MFRRVSIRVRLTIWYAGVLAAALLLFSGGAWWALDRSLTGAVDDALKDRVEGVRLFIEEQGTSLPLEEMRMEFREHSVLGPGGDLFQVRASDGSWIYRSGPLYESTVPVYTAAQLGSGPRLQNIEIRAVPLRFLSQTIVASGRNYVVQVAAPLHEISEGKRYFFTAMLAGLPLLLLLAVGGGYVLSRRALDPIDQITAAARDISERNLSRSLPVPATGDEVERLSETLNAIFARLAAAFERNRRFSADASHELRTPVALIRTTAELALRKERTNDEYREALQQILTETERTSELIDALLFLARADAGVESVRMEPTDVTAVARGVASYARVLAESKGLSFELAAVPDAHAQADGRALRRAMVLLLDNAAKYTSTGGAIRLTVEQRDGTVITEVVDSGIGISEEDLPHVFDRFYRADKARSNDSGGAGLGLAIAKTLVETMGGTISAESRPDHGSRFRITVRESQSG